MDENDIQSPLPSRQPNIDKQPATTEITEESGQSTMVSTPVTEVKNPENTKKNPMKFLFFLGVIILLGVIGYLGKNLLGGSVPGQKVTLNYWGLWEDNAILEGIIADFESQNPNIKINYTRNQKDDYRTRLAGRLEKDSAEAEVPDIFRIHSSWFPMFKDKLALVPEKTAENIGLNTDYYEVYKNTLKQKGQYWAVPLMYDGLSMFYNKDLLESASVTAPKSWWELKTTAAKLTVKDSTGKIQIAGAGMGMVDNVDHWSDIVGLMMLQGGVDPLSTDPAEIKKMQDVLTFYTLFYTGDRVWDESLPSSTQLFASGKLAFYFGPSWRVFNIEEMKIPTLKYEITTVPQLPVSSEVSSTTTNEAELTNIHWSTFWAEGVSKNSKHQKEAFAFLEFLSQKENLEKLYQAAADTRAFGEIYPRVSLQDSMRQNTQTAPYVKAANNAAGWYLSSRTFDSGLNDEMMKYFGDAINSIVKKQTDPGAVMTDLTMGIQQLKTKYGL